jgi:hypothetical protein
VRQFKPKMVAMKDGSKVAELKELIKDVDQQPEILVSRRGGACRRRGAAAAAPLLSRPPGAAGRPRPTAAPGSRAPQRGA